MYPRPSLSRWCTTCTSLSTRIVQHRLYRGGIRRSVEAPAMLRLRQSCAAEASLEVARQAGVASGALPQLQYCVERKGEITRLGSDRYVNAAATFVEYCRLLAQAAVYLGGWIKIPSYKLLRWNGDCDMKIEENG